jgi:hypothetical protein
MRCSGHIALRGHGWRPGWAMFVASILSIVCMGEGLGRGRHVAVMVDKQMLKRINSTRTCVTAGPVET